MIKSRASTLILAILLAWTFLTACQPSPRDTTVVSGKTVHGDLAIENVLLQVHLWEESGWKHIGDSQSGYHGSFRLHLEPGEYLITAEGSVRVDGKEKGLYGRLVPLVVEEGVRRMDQVVIDLEKG
jgi:hypothetical protein